MIESGQVLREFGIRRAQELADKEFDTLYVDDITEIPGAVATAIYLAKNHNRDVSVCIERDEAKDHGEGGRLIGELRGKVLHFHDC